MKQIRSLLEELEAMGRDRDINHVIESRANNVINSAIHLLELIEKNCTPEQTATLTQKLIVAIRARDPSKFTKTLRKPSE